MDFWDMTIDDALSGAAHSAALAEKVLVEYASIDIADALAALPENTAVSRRPAVAVSAQSKNSVEDETNAVTRKTNSDQRGKSTIEKATGNAVSLNKAYFDVQKFVVSGVEGAEKEAAKERLAISLGAKPKKRKYLNYKELKKERRKAKQDVKEMTSRVCQGKIKKRKAKESGKKKLKNKNGKRRR